MHNNSVEKINNSPTLFCVTRNAFVACIVSALLFSGAAPAAEWTNKIGATVSSIYTNNIGLRESGEESDLIPIVAPFWSITGEGSRANLEFMGTIETKDVGGNRNATDLNFQANADAELIERIFFIDLVATGVNNAVDPLARTGSDTINDSANSTTTYTAKISPYVQGRIKRFANFEGRFTFDFVKNEDVDDSDTRRRELVLSLTSGTEFGDISWSINGSKKRNVSQSGSENDNGSLSANIGRQLNRQWQINGTVGEESTDFSSRGKTGGNFWEVGTIWTPSERTKLDVGYGRRFSGKTGHLDFSHRTKRSVFTANFSQEITTNSELLSDQVVFTNFRVLTDPDTGLIVRNPVTGDPLIIADREFLSGIENNAQFLNDRFSASYTVQGKRTTFTLDANYIKQTSGDESETESRGIGATLNRDISGILSANASARFDRQTAADDTESDVTRLTLGLNQKLSKKTSVDLSYTHTERESDRADDSYDEDRITLSLRHEL